MENMRDKVKGYIPEALQDAYVGLRALIVDRFQQRRYDPENPGVYDPRADPAIVEKARDLYQLQEAALSNGCAGNPLLVRRRLELQNTFGFDTGLGRAWPYLVIETAPQIVFAALGRGVNERAFSLPYTP